MMIFLFLVFICSVFGPIPFGNEISLPGGSPRFVNYQNSSGDWVVVGYEAVSGPNKQIVAILSKDGMNWYPPVVVAQDTQATTDLANPNLYQLPNGRLLCAFRHHTIQSGHPTIYRIEVCYTDNMDHWTFLGTVEAYSATNNLGIWEPFLFQVPNSNNIYCAYAKEISGGEQNIVARISEDGGANWGSEFIISHTSGSRDGMPTVNTLNDGSLLAVFEGWWAGTRGKFTVNSRRSFDQGRTWVQPQIIHQSALSHNSGAPWATKLVNGSLVVAFMTDEDWTGTLNWPQYASIKILIGNPSAGSITWNDLQLVGQPSSYWPSVYSWTEDKLVFISYNSVYRTAHE